MSKVHNICFNKEYAFIIGNGLNIAMGKKDNWQSVIDSIHAIWSDRGYYNDDCTDILKSSIFSVAKMDAMILALKEVGDGENQIKNREAKTLSALVDKIKDIRFRKNSSTMLDFICNKNLSILTTNFDLNIENYLWQESFTPKDTWNAGSNYMLERCYCKNDNTEKSNQSTKVWHIHGSVDKYRTILFSTSRYMRMARRITQLLNGKDKLNLESTWLKDFLTKPLIIAGLGLGPEEFLLRWLFIERSHYLQREKISLAPSYYLYLKENKNSKALKEKFAFLKMVDITPVCMEKDIFNNPVWNTNDMTVQLVEVEL